MNRRTVIATPIILVALALIWWLVSPLFINQTVDEAFPFDLPTVDEMAAMTDNEKVAAIEQVETALEDEEAMAALSEDEMETLEGQIMEISAEMPDKEVADEMPEETVNTEPVIVAQGEFMDADDFHQGSGTAKIFQQDDSRILRLENFASTNGPDLRVLLVENIAGTRSEELGNYVDLGKLKGNIGSQNYEIPADIDISQYSGVMIYCMPFHVVFSTAAF